MTSEKITVKPRSTYLHLNKTISFNHPCACRIELSNPSCLTAVCKRGSVEFTDTARIFVIKIQHGFKTLFLVRYNNS